MNFRAEQRGKSPVNDDPKRFLNLSPEEEL